MITTRHKTERAKKIAFWEPHIAAWRSSELGATAYCRQHNLSLHKFKYWQYQITKGKATQQKTSESISANQTDFVEVVQPHTAFQAINTLSCCEIVTQHGFSIVLSRDLLPTHLQNVLLTLKSIA